MAGTSAGAAKGQETMKMPTAEKRRVARIAVRYQKENDCSVRVACLHASEKSLVSWTTIRQWWWDFHLQRGYGWPEGKGCPPGKSGHKKRRKKRKSKKAYRRKNVIEPNGSGEVQATLFDDEPENPPNLAAENARLRSEIDAIRRVFRDEIIARLDASTEIATLNKVLACVREHTG